MFLLSLFVVSCLVSLHSTEGAALTVQPQKLMKFSKDINDVIIKEAAVCVPPGEKLDDLLKVIREGKYRDDDNFKNFLHCGYKNSGYANADGTINVEKAAPQFPDPAAMRTIMVECDKNRGSTPTENTFEYFKCFQKYTPFLMGLYA